MSKCPMMRPMIAAQQRVPDEAGSRRSSPRVAAAVKEAILLIVVCRVAVRLDGADLGERGFYRGALVDRLEPAREVCIVVPLHALHVVIAGPREGGDVGDGIFAAGDIGRFRQLLF